MTSNRCGMCGAPAMPDVRGMLCEDCREMCNRYEQKLVETAREMVRLALEMKPPPKPGNAG